MSQYTDFLNQTHAVEEGFTYTEEKAMVVAAAWGTELIKLHAVLAIFHQDDLKIIV